MREETETIINGTNVSECPLFYDHKIGCYHTFDGECVKDSCAVYKWLLEYKHLQEENKELKELKCKFKEYCTCDTERLQEENEGLKSLNDFNVQKIEVLQEENEELYKALEEIRNIAETPIIADKNRFDEITNKIDEALNDRD